MSAVPEPASLSVLAEGRPCPECAQVNPWEEEYCSACGAALHGSVGHLSLLPLLPIGTCLADRYVIEAAESCGHENRYQATDEADSARQVLLYERASEDAHLFQARFERVTSLIHPALLGPEHTFVQSERSYLVSPRIPGVHLGERTGRTSEREAVSWGVQLCQVVGFLHRRGYLCGELPPENLLLDKDGRVRVTQLAMLREKGTDEEWLPISDGYVAPEVYRAGDIGEQVDVFAIATVLYSLLVGRRLPVEGWLVQYEPPTFYPDKVVSPGCERVLRKALAPDAKDRYENIDAFKSALVAIGQGSRVRSAWLTDVGQVREHNEDAVLVEEHGQGTVSGNAFCGLYVVSDGMGGAEAGEIASAITIATIAQDVAKNPTDNTGQADTAWEGCLREAVEAANTAILAYAKEHPASTGLGATVVAAVVEQQRLSLAWVGDSRIYLWEHGRLSQLSRDHSLVSRLVEIGQLSAVEARTHEHRNVLIRSLGSKEAVVVDTLTCPFKRGARLLLCSDGLTSHVEDHAIADILSRHRDPEDAAMELVVAANAGGGSDNISVVVVFHE